MTTRRQRTLDSSLPATGGESRPALDKYPARRFPIQQIQELQKDLNAFNERIADLENEGHRGHAMEVLKANAIDFARQIDELRCLLVESASKDALKRPFRKLSHR
jgi:H2-forming N5,N10-methylenetetrahydromethanopterin dehydrogenase-like enzyme